MEENNNVDVVEREEEQKEAEEATEGDAPVEEVAKEEE